ncbi:hypothetical protein ABZ532_08820 [Streptomyces sp. NPDC019396]|uniref:hypothetical protein n=1 Tax=Streptomyces sp. NPDC019396 TaxID=3154687 RepID=UPI0033C181CE
MRFAQLTPGGLYVMRTYRPDWELTLIRVSSSPHLWRWNEKRWSYEVAEDARRVDLRKRVGYLAVAPPAAWPESDGVGGMLRRGIQRWARPMAALRFPLPDPSVSRVAWHDLPTHEEEMSWMVFAPGDIVCPYTSPEEFEQRIRDRMTVLGAAQGPVFQPPPPGSLAPTDVHRAALRLDVLAELLERIPDPQP